MTLLEERRQWEEYAIREKLPENVAVERELISEVPCLWIRDESEIEGDAILLYIHGGGLTSGSALTHRNFVARIAEVVGIRCLVVDYRLLPEHPFPAPLEDVVYRADKLFSAEIPRVVVWRCRHWFSCVKKGLVCP